MDRSTLYSTTQSGLSSDGSSYRPFSAAAAAAAAAPREPLSPPQDRSRGGSAAAATVAPAPPPREAATALGSFAATPRPDSHRKHVGRAWSTGVINFSAAHDPAWPNPEFLSGDGLEKYPNRHDSDPLYSSFGIGGVFTVFPCAHCGRSLPAGSFTRGELSRYLRGGTLGRVTLPNVSAFYRNDDWALRKPLPPERPLHCGSCKNSQRAERRAKEPQAQQLPRPASAATAAAPGGEYAAVEAVGRGGVGQRAVVTAAAAGASGARPASAPARRRSQEPQLIDAGFGGGQPARSGASGKVVEVRRPRQLAAHTPAALGEEARHAEAGTAAAAKAKAEKAAAAAAARAAARRAQQRAAAALCYGKGGCYRGGDAAVGGRVVVASVERLAGILR